MVIYKRDYLVALDVKQKTYNDTKEKMITLYFAPDITVSGYPSQDLVLDCRCSLLDEVLYPRLSCFDSHQLLFAVGVFRIFLQFLFFLVWFGFGFPWLTDRPVPEPDKSRKADIHSIVHCQCCHGAPLTGSKYCRHTGQSCGHSAWFPSH